MDDFFFVVKNYHEIAGEELFEGNYDDLLEGDFEMQIASAKNGWQTHDPYFN